MCALVKSSPMGFFVRGKVEEEERKKARQERANQRCGEGKKLAGGSLSRTLGHGRTTGMSSGEFNVRSSDDQNRQTSVIDHCGLLYRVISLHSLLLHIVLACIQLRHPAFGPAISHRLIGPICPFVPFCRPLFSWLLAGLHWQSEGDLWKGTIKTHQEVTGFSWLISMEIFQIQKCAQFVPVDES
jgi:hypothetical protein